MLTDYGGSVNSDGGDGQGFVLEGWDSRRNMAAPRLAAKGVGRRG